MTKFSCPTCQTVLQATAEQAGMAITCPNCQVPIHVPKEEPTVAQPLAGNAGLPPPMPTVEQWFFNRNGIQQGPVTAEQLRGMITPNDLVWKQGLPQWVPASTIPNLLGIPIPTPYAPPPLPPKGYQPHFPVAIGDLNQTVNTAIWIKAISGGGIFLIFISLFLPWYGALSLLWFMGIQTAPGILIFLLIPGAGVLSFWPPRRWAKVGVAGICLLMFFFIIWGFFHDIQVAGIPLEIPLLPGPFITLLGDLTLATSAILAFFGIGSQTPQGRAIMG